VHENVLCVTVVPWLLVVAVVTGAVLVVLATAVEDVVE
jgi:hypothetical protein